MAAGLVKENEQGQLAGVNVALAGLMSMLGPLWAGAVYDHFTPNAPFWMGSILLILAYLLLAHIQVRAQTQTSNQVNTFSTAD
jgi:predicted MFS family arabinose efflux permease